MLKVISLLKRKDELSLEEFRRWAMEEHPLLGKQLPGIQAYRMSVVNVDDPSLPCDAVSEFWFQDEEARVAAFATSQGKAAAEDAAAHCSSRIHLLTQEKVIIE